MRERCLGRCGEGMGGFAVEGCTIVRAWGGQKGRFFRGLGGWTWGPTYGTLVRVLSGIADVVGRQLDRPFVEGREKGFGKGDFGHDVGGEGRIERAWCFFGERQTAVCCLFAYAREVLMDRMLLFRVMWDRLRWSFFLELVMKVINCGSFGAGMIVTATVVTSFAAFSGKQRRLPSRRFCVYLPSTQLDQSHANLSSRLEHWCVARLLTTRSSSRAAFHLLFVSSPPPIEDPTRQSPFIMAVLPSPLRSIALGSAVILLLPSLALAHGGHEAIPEGEVISPEPLDTTLWIHILLQTFTWGILMPTGMVLGLARSRWHVPTQILATALAVVGYFLGHLHKGRQFGKNVHALFANWLMIMLIAQVVGGLYLRLHLERGFIGKIRPWLVRGHAILGGILPVAAWVQMVFGGIAAQGFCQADHTGQCAAHFIMGSAFIGYGIVLTLLLLNGQAFLARTGRSQEFWDSLIISIWGCINTFTEHRWGDPWVRNDLQHTTMGIIWWAAGLVGIWLSRDRQGRPRRNLIPAIVILLTGWGMSAHPQDLMLSTHVHAVFGYTLMAAGLVRIIEISFVLRDRTTLVGPAGGDVDAEINSFQYLTPFLLYAGGFLFMGATEEQMALLASAGVSHVSYILILYSISFLLFLFVLMLLHLYSAYHPFTGASADSAPKLGGDEQRPNGAIRLPHNPNVADRDAQEFELEGLMSDADDADDDAAKPLNGHAR
nr:protein ytp1 [Quercus suber]